MRSPVNAYSFASSRLVCSGHVSGPPSAATSPTITCGSERYADSAMYTTSESAITLQPRPTAGPFTAATTGMRQRIMLSTSSRPSAIVSRRSVAVLGHAVEEVEVAAGRERTALAGDHRDARVGVGAELREQLREAEVQLVVDRVELLGPRQPHDADGPSASTRIDVGQVVLHGISFSEVGKTEDARGDDVLLDLRRATHDALRPAVEVGLERDVVGVDHRARARHRERGAPDRLLDPGHEQLVDRAAGTVLDAVEPLGESPAHVQPQHLGLHVRPRDRLALIAAVRAGSARTVLLELLAPSSRSGRRSPAHRARVVADDRHREAPPLAGLADHVLGRDARAVEHT